MRRRAVQMAVAAVMVALLFVGVPLALVGSRMVWDSQQATLETRTQTLARAIDRRLALDDPVDVNMLTPWIDGRVNLEARIIVNLPDGSQVVAGDIGSGKVLRSSRQTAAVDGSPGAVVIMEIRAKDVQGMVLRLVLLVGMASAIAFLFAVGWAMRSSRKIAAPLIYLAAAAEQLGSGQTRPNLKPSGIEEIDLVQAEMVRSADRLAGRIAAERQFAADASHQLRTPLTSLSMRLEEIQYLSDNQEVKDEAELCLQQVERLTGVVADLLAASRSAQGGTAEALKLTDVFAQQEEEWHAAFEDAGRQLVFEDGAGRHALASPGALSQVLATLIENSLKYGAGTTSITTRAASGRGVFIDVADEGEGVSDHIVDDLFSKGVSGHGSTGIGLALARDLVAADGGRLELTARTPPVFTIFLNGLPTSLAPEHVMPLGSLITVGRRRRRR